jgi:hypothetical protein
MARLLQNGEVVEEARMDYAGTQSTYSAKLAAVAPGDYQLEVLALDANNANFGHVRRPITITP